MPCYSQKLHFGCLLMHSTQPLSKRRHGSTVVEATVAVGIVGLFLAGLYQTNARALSMLKSGLEGVSGTRVLVNTMERIRTSTWTQITDPNYLSGTVLANAPAPGHLGIVTETIELTTFPVVEAATVRVVRASDGTVTIAKPGDGSLAAQWIASATPPRACYALVANVTISWRTTFNGVLHTRTMSNFISPGGVLGRNQ